MKRVIQTIVSSRKQSKKKAECCRIPHIHICEVRLDIYTLRYHPVWIARFGISACTISMQKCRNMHFISPGIWPGCMFPVQLMCDAINKLHRSSIAMKVYTRYHNLVMDKKSVLDTFRSSEDILLAYSVVAYFILYKFHLVYSFSIRFYMSYSDPHKI